MAAANPKAPPEQLATKAGLSADDFDEPTKAEILDDLRTALQQALAGEGRPARAALAEIRRAFAESETDSLP